MKTPPKKNGKKKRTPEDLQDIIIEATKLSLEIDKQVAALEALKGAIRDNVLAMMGPDQNSFAIDTKLGKCHVVKVRDHLVIAPGVDADVLQKNMPEDLWNVFFVQKPVLRGTATEAFMRLNEEHRSQLGDPAPFVMMPRLAQVRLPK